MAAPDSSELLERALELEPAKRLSLATRLLDSVENAESAEWAEAWGQELDRRLQAMDAGTDAGEDWAVVRARVVAGLSSR